MAHEVEHLKHEIESLEKQLATKRFGGLFDRKLVEQLEDKLKKKRKELAKLEHGDDDDLDAGHDHIDIPDFDAPIGVAPDLVGDFPIDLDADDLPIKPSASKTSAVKTTAKSAAKPVAKKPATKAKPAAKPKAKPKPSPKKKSAAKPAKKKSKK